MPATKENQHATLTLQGDWDAIHQKFIDYAESIKNLPDDHAITVDVQDAQRYPACECIETGNGQVWFTMIHRRYGNVGIQQSTGRLVVNYWVEIR